MLHDILLMRFSWWSCAPEEEGKKDKRKKKGKNGKGEKGKRRRLLADDSVEILCLKRWNYITLGTAGNVGVGDIVMFGTVVHVADCGLRIAEMMKMMIQMLM